MAHGAHHMIKANKAISVVEYSVMIVMILSALYVMREPISRGIFAKHKTAGDSFAFGRQYDAKRTTVCKQDVQSYSPAGTPIMGPFYDEACYHARVTRDPILLPGGCYSSTGGCPQCHPGSSNSAGQAICWDNITSANESPCRACEDNIKASCGNPYCDK